MGVGLKFSPPNAHHMVGKAERPWRTIRDNAYAMLYSMAVPNFMWSCAVNTVVYMRNRTYNRSIIGLTGGVPLTLLTSSAPDATKFRVFGCTVFAKVPDKWRRKLSEKAFRGVMVGYPPNAHGYRIYNPKTRRITTSVHVLFQENTLGFGAHLPVHSVSADASDADDPQDPSLTSHPLDTLPPTITQLSEPQSTHAADRPSLLRSHPLRYGDLVAHISEYPPVLVSACCDHEQGNAKEDIFEQHFVPDRITSPHHILARASHAAVALFSARDFVEPKTNGLLSLAPKHQTSKPLCNKSTPPSWTTAHENSSTFPRTSGRQQHVDLQSQV
jgi:hypothetical protein